MEEMTLWRHRGFNKKVPIHFEVKKQATIPMWSLESQIK